MKSVVLDTIKDIGLILRAFDLGGCTDGAPEDEYMHEAAEIYTIAVKRRIYAIDSAASYNHVCLLHDIIDDVFLRAFGDFLYNPPQMEIEQVARAILQAWRSNIEFHSGKKAKW